LANCRPSTEISIAAVGKRPFAGQVDVGRVQSFTEWQPLEEVIVGRVFPVRTPASDLSFKLFFNDNLHKNYVFADKEFDLPNRFVEEGEEDLEQFSDTLRNEGVTVRRPAPIEPELTTFTSPYGFKGYLTPPLNIRDQTLIYGNKIIETPPLVRTRLYENDFLKPLFYEYMREGAVWLSAPRPMMVDMSFDYSYVLRVSPERKFPRSATRFDIGFEMLLDGAQCMRFGRDIVINVSNENHRLGYTWLKSVLPEARFHEICVTDSHIDGRLVPLRPGKLLIDARMITSLDMLPPALRKWDIIRVTAAELNPAAYEHESLSLASIAIDINVLSIDEHKVVVNRAAKGVIRLLEQHGFTPVPVNFRHGRILGGAFHCVTLDVRRRGTCESFLD
jgi:glycine amidinotransferase